MQVGQGHRVGEKLVIELPKENHPLVKAIGLSTGWTATGLWRTSHYEEKTFTINTKEHTDYWASWFTPATTYMIFRLRATENVYFQLAESPHNTPNPGQYEVLIGLKID